MADLNAAAAVSQFNWWYVAAFAAAWGGAGVFYFRLLYSKNAGATDREADELNHARSVQEHHDGIRRELARVIMAAKLACDDAEAAAIAAAAAPDATGASKAAATAAAAAERCADAARAASMSAKVLLPYDEQQHLDDAGTRAPTAADAYAETAQAAAERAAQYQDREGKDGLCPNPQRAGGPLIP